MTEATIDVAPFVEGRLPRTDLLSAELSFAAWISLSKFTEYSIFRLQAENFYLDVVIRAGLLILTRNGFTAERPLARSVQPGIGNRIPLENPCHIAFTWSPTKLTVYVNAVPTTVETPPTVPPISLLQWARRQAILPATKYTTERRFCDVLLNGLSGLEDKITTTRMQTAFWDFTYDGNKITARTPKRETQVHPTIHGLLHDIAIAKNLMIHPEAASGSGRLDFLITGTLENGNIVKACLEFK